MLAFQQRVVEERQALIIKIDSLAPFIGSEIYQALSSEEQKRLVKQLDIMHQYVQILAERIQNFVR